MCHYVYTSSEYTLTFAYMLYLTKTESKIVEFLKSGPKSAYDLEQEIDRAKDFSPDYIKVMVFKLNKKKKLVESYNENGERMYRLLGGGVEYRILEGVYNAMEEMQVLKYLACDTCAYRANAEVKRKVDKIYMGLVGFVGLLLLAL